MGPSTERLTPSRPPAQLAAWSRILSSVSGQSCIKPCTELSPLSMVSEHGRGGPRPSILGRSRNEPRGGGAQVAGAQDRPVDRAWIVAQLLRQRTGASVRGVAGSGGEALGQHRRLTLQPRALERDARRGGHVRRGV